MPKIRRVAAAALAGVVVSGVAAETLTVCADGCEFTSIQAAVDAASDGDIIQLSAETYTEGFRIDTRGKSLVILGATNPEGRPASIIDGINSHQILHAIQGSKAVLSLVNVNFSRGRQSSVGETVQAAGGVFISGGTAHVINCDFFGNIHNDEGGGGALRWQAGSRIEVDGCRFESNSAWKGGAVYIRDSLAAMARLSGCEFVSNAATENGGGSFFYQVDPELDDCTFRLNTAKGNGGAVHCNAADADLEACVLVGNAAGGQGGAIRIGNSSQAILSSCILRGNWAGDAGGGIFAQSASAELVQSWFCRNTPEHLEGVLGGEFTTEGCEFDTNCCDGDLNLDNLVDSADLGLLVAAWNTNGSIVDGSDINGDGTVNAADLGLLIGAWGDCDGYN